MAKALTIFGMAIALLIFCLFGLDAAIKFPFDRANMGMDIGAIICAGHSRLLELGHVQRTNLTRRGGSLPPPCWAASRALSGCAEDRVGCAAQPRGGQAGNGLGHRAGLNLPFPFAPCDMAQHVA